jgi:PilZ domain
MSKASRVRAVDNGQCMIEMRTAARYRILQRCFVHCAKAAAPQAWQCIAYNISETGIGVTLPISLQEGTVLSIQAWNLPRACPLQARIVKTREVEFLWFTGCELVKSLSDAELRIWRSGPLDWLDHHKD